MNLINNALKFTHKDGSVVIKVNMVFQEEKNTLIAFEVKIQEYIAPDKLERLF
jgi:signal transduction histidine kinase